MKKLIAVFLVVLFLFSSALLALAHPGNTDIIGGHRDSDTGRYHYHHGYPAHQHPNGECPYDFDDKTESSSSGISSSFDELKQQASLKELKSLSESRLLYIIILCVTLAILFVVLILTVNKKNKEEENRKSAESKIEELKKEVERLKNVCTEKTDLYCVAFSKNIELKKQINEISNDFYKEQHNDYIKIKSFVAEHFALVLFPKRPTESLSDYVIRILEIENKKPLHYTDTGYIGRKPEAQKLGYAKFIKQKYENKGYKVILFKSICTAEKYLFAYNDATALIIQCILSQEELSNIEHVYNLNNTLFDIRILNKRDNINAVLICNASLSDEMKDLLHKYAFNYRENIELTEEK